jgi:RND family efflux transporter MFP subunit
VRALLPAVVCLVTCIACGRQEPPPRAVEDETIPVAAQPAELGRVRAVLHASGLVVPAPGAEFLVTAPEPARILDVTRAEGEAIASGELLVRLDIPSADADASRRRAEAAQARADLENARAAQARARDFADRGLIARRELEDAERTLTEAQSALSRAEVLLADAEAAAARTTILAPFSGIVSKRLHDPGDVVSGAATDPILRLVDPKRLEIRASVPLKDLSRVLPGATARLAGGGDAAAAKLTVASRPGTMEIGPDGTVPVRLTFAEPATLTVDTPVQVDIDLDERANAVMVAPEAVIGEGTATAVFVVAGDRAVRRPVTVGIADDRQVEITSGVRAGELVIVRGHTGLEDGARISVAVSR